MKEIRPNKKRNGGDEDDKGKGDILPSVRLPRVVDVAQTTKDGRHQNTTEEDINKHTENYLYCFHSLLQLAY